MSIQQKKEKIGLFVCTCLVAGNLIGSGIYVLPIYLANYGIQGISVWLVAACSAIVIAILFSRLGSVLPNGSCGGPYYYARRCYSNMTGFVVGWTYWISVWTGIAVIAVTFASYASNLIPSLSGHVSLSAIVVVWILTLMNLAGIRVGGMVQSLLFIGKMLPLLAIVFYALPMTDFANITTIVPLIDPVSLDIEWNLILVAFTAVWWGFLGIESATVVAGHIKNPARTLPLATIIGVLIPTATYCLITLTTLGNLPTEELIASSAPLADLGVKLWGSFGITFVTVGALVACLGTLNGWIIVQGHILMAMAHDQMLPNFLEYKNKHGAPVLAYLLSGFSISAMIFLTRDLDFSKIFEFISLVSVVTCFLAYIICCYAEISYRAKHKTLHETHWVIHLLSAFGFISCLLGIATTNKEVLLCSVLLVLLGVPFYAYGQIKKEE